jgi:hypothetical protein
MTRADCGKRFYPCGAAARRLGCPEQAVQCSGEGDFCASPSDAMLGAARCLPLPLRCGKRNNACCPANTDARYRELWNQDGRSPVPYCSDEGTMCIWQHKQYATYGLRILNEAAYSKSLVWDGALWWLCVCVCVCVWGGVAVLVVSQFAVKRNTRGQLALQHARLMTACTPCRCVVVAS